MPEYPLWPCPYDGCAGTVAYADDPCGTCDGEIDWVPVESGLDGKLPNQNGGLKPVVRPSGG